MPKALVVDDNRTTADSLCAMLGWLGLEAEAAYSARAALYALEKSRPDVMLVDLHLPGIEGYDVIAYLRRDPRLESVPVIVVTSEDQPEAHARARRTGALLVLVKPVQMEDLEDALRKAGLLPLRKE